MFSFRGRIGRLEYVAHRLVAALIVLFGYLAAKVVSGATWDEPITALLPRTIATAAIVVAIVAVMTASVRRCHDLGLSGIWVILLAVPFFGAIFGLYLTFRHGQYGFNRYGYEGGGSPHANGLSPRDLHLAQFGR